MNTDDLPYVCFCADTVIAPHTNNTTNKTRRNDDFIISMFKIINKLRLFLFAKLQLFYSTYKYKLKIFISDVLNLRILTRPAQ